jgi:hypothetical protein
MLKLPYQLSLQIVRGFSENCLERRYDRDLMDCIITQQQQQLIAARLLVSSQKENDVINTTFIDVFYRPYGTDDEVRLEL